MFKKSEKEKPLDLNRQEISTIIGEGYTIKGELTGSSVIRIDGKVIGNVNVEAGIVLGETGVIEGDLLSNSAIIFGTVKGNVKAGQLEIKKSGRIHGDIETDTLEIELGAQFNGKLAMNKKVKLDKEIQKEELEEEELQEVG